MTSRLSRLFLAALLCYPLTILAQPVYEPLKSFVALGSGLGSRGMDSADVDGDGKLEVLLTTGRWWSEAYYWHLLAYQPSSASYEVNWSSPLYSGDGIGHATLVEIDGKYHALLGLRNGDVELHDPDKHKLLTRVNVSAEAINQVGFGDADNDGRDEFLIATSNHIYLYEDLEGAPELVLEQGADSFALGNIDSDGALELVLNSGWVLQLDGSVSKVEWDYSSSGFGRRVALADSNANGRQEIFAAAAWYRITVFDAHAKTPLWERETDHDIDGMRLLDVNGDGVEELLYGDAQWGSVFAIDLATQTELWSLRNPESGVSNILAADLDDDSTLELIWGAGVNSTGEDLLFVHSLDDLTLEWQSTDLRGPFEALEYGDSDGDGQIELVYASSESDSGYSDGTVFVRDAQSFDLEWQSPPNAFGGTAWQGLRDLHVSDVDEDGSPEIVVATDRLYDGRISVFDGVSNSLEADYVYGSHEDMRAVDSADVDADGEIEIVALSSDRLFIINGSNGEIEWQSTVLDGGLMAQAGIEIANLDQDPALEILVSMQWLYLIDGISHHQHRSIGNNFRGIAIGDMEGDGTAEIFAGTLDGALVALSATDLKEQRRVGPCTGSVDGVVADERPGLERALHIACESDLLYVRQRDLAVVERAEIGDDELGIGDSLALAELPNGVQIAVGSDSRVSVLSVSTRADRDADGYADSDDAMPDDPMEWLDTDGDGIGNNADHDDDNDGVVDSDDAFPLDASESVDTDGDGIGNNADDNDDNDGELDVNDAFPLDPTETSDNDGDGIGDNADGDDDNDGVDDVDDRFPLDASESVDTDWDGIGNNADDDDDNDGVLDVDDAFPLNGYESSDYDGDGIGDNADPDDDNDGVDDHIDAFPHNAAESLDTDGDGIGNNTDFDDDGDSVNDADDAFPLDASEQWDTDGDGIGNNADPDDDNDNVLDGTDAFPLDPSESSDRDGDGYGDNRDAFPDDASEHSDRDGDGVGDNADPAPDDPAISSNVSPQAAAVSVILPSDGGLIQLAGSDADSNPLQYELLGGQAHGSVQLLNIALGTVRFVPNQGWTGSDSFRYRVSDGIAWSGVALVTVEVSADDSDDGSNSGGGGGGGAAGTLLLIAAGALWRRRRVARHH